MGASEMPDTRPPPTASALYHEAEVGANGGGQEAANTGIRYRVLLRAADGSAAEVDADTTFRSGDRIRLAFEPNTDGFLYVIQRGSSGRWSMLVPHPEINGGRNRVRRFEEVTIPPEGWFRFDDTPGTEQLFVYLGREPVDALPGGEGSVSETQATDAHTVSVIGGSVRRRDLVFDKEEETGSKGSAAYVVNQTGTGGAVAWTVELEHR